MKMMKIALGTALLVVTLSAGGWKYTQLIQERDQLKNRLQTVEKDPQILAREEMAALVGEVGKLVLLPEGEDPVVATVTDKEKLKDQLVFAKAENGDKILIYAKAKKAYIYNPNKNVIVDVVPVNIGETQSASGSADVAK